MSPLSFLTSKPRLGSSGLTLERAGSSFAPSDISGLQLWLDAQDVVSGAEPSDGAGVASWQDKSGVGNHATFILGPTKQPTYQAAGLNGLPTVRFDGTDDDLAFAGGLLQNVAGWTVFGVVRSSNVAAQRNILTIATAAITGTRATFGQVAGGNVTVGSRGTDAGAFVGGASVASDTSPHLFTGIVDLSAGTSSIRRDRGAASATGSAPTANTSNTTSAGSRVGAAVNSGSAFWIGDISSLILYGRVLNTTERDQVETFLANKWGTP